MLTFLSHNKEFKHCNKNINTETVSPGFDLQGQRSKVADEAKKSGSVPEMDQQESLESIRK